MHTRVLDTVFPHATCVKHAYMYMYIIRYLITRDSCLIRTIDSGIEKHVIIAVYTYMYMHMYACIHVRAHIEGTIPLFIFLSFIFLSFSLVSLSHELYIRLPLTCT